ncbi:MAG: nucleoside triphosphate pyrophosphatase [Sphingomicrobium sp.]
MPLILASASSTRRQMLDAAGIAYGAQPSTIDESAFKSATGDPRVTALELAKAKALDVSRQAPDEWVIGSDSIVSVEGRLFDKPASRDDAVEHLRFFSGKTMELTSAVGLARRGEIDWEHGETARLQVRSLSDAFIAAYLDAEWPEVGYCVGVFRMEGRGVNLFESVTGDHFAILGMPLIPLLGALRERGVIA